MNYKQITVFFLILNSFIFSQPVKEWQQWAERPPMGWNSYDSFGAAVFEEEVKANAHYMAEKLKDFGWEYIVVDYCWSYPHPPGSKDDNPPQFKTKRGTLVPWLAMDEFGRLLPDTRKFPSCNEEVGFKPLADYVHSLGLKFGIHVMRGIPRQAVINKYPIKGAPGIDASMIADTSSTCSWLNQMWGLDMSKKGAQEYLNSIIDLYASWDVDYIKVDDMQGQGEYHKAEVEGYRKAIDQSGREIVLSLSPKIGFDEAAGHVENYANLWRISADFWDRWDRLEEMFELLEKWNDSRMIGSWPDADMIPFGKLRIRGPFGKEEYSNFTKDEHYTLMTLWCIAKSPLMFGGDMPQNDEFTEYLITNEEVLEANISGSNPKLLFKDGDKIAWVSESADGGKYLALFNLGDEQVTINVSLDKLGFSSLEKVRNLWAKQDEELINNTIEVIIPSHGASFYKINK